ncbi:MAG: hypothetical protein MJE68_33330, partial [Proteobacteria bacterium]|nr:hypothetical protein [Pseudomonadota bacterium]
MPEQALGWIPLGFGIVVEDKPSELSCLQELAPTAVNLKDNEGRTSESHSLHVYSTVFILFLFKSAALHLAVAAGNVPVIETLVCVYAVFQFGTSNYSARGRR